MAIRWLPPVKRRPDATSGNGADRWQSTTPHRAGRQDRYPQARPAGIAGGDAGSGFGRFIPAVPATVISVDRDSAGSAFKSTDLVTLENVQLTLNDVATVTT